MSKSTEWVDPDPRGMWWGEHRSRYHFAARWVAGKRVLDAACGSGYGCHILATAGADFTIGVDRSSQALARAREVHSPYVGLVRADVSSIPVASRSMDVVVSFETLEHVQDGPRFLDECRRLLSDGGRLILSTPNALITRPREGVPANPFHVREYEPSELHALLKRFFESVELFGQWPEPTGRPNPFTSNARGTRGLGWRLRHRLIPFALKDAPSRLVYGRGFYPGEYDYAFTAAATDRAHVLVAVCR